MYYEVLLEPPGDLPLTVDKIAKFLGQTPIKLPVLDTSSYCLINLDDLLTLDVPKEATSLAIMVGSCLYSMRRSQPLNQVTGSSHSLDLTGTLIANLNDEAPLRRQVQNLTNVLDTTYPVEGLSRPDYQLFVKGCLMLRWENRLDYEFFAEAMHENVAKLKEKLTDAIKIRLYFPSLAKQAVLRERHFISQLRVPTTLCKVNTLRKKKTAVILLEPVGDPDSKPVTLKGLEDATHDVLCGLRDLHQAGYTHRDIRWDNIIKVTVKGAWKWMLIDLGKAGVVMKTGLIPLWRFGKILLL